MRLKSTCEERNFFLILRYDCYVHDFATLVTSKIVASSLHG